jgi:hypothetical protein
MRIFFPHLALAVFLAACGGSAGSMHARQESPYLHIVPPSEDGDEKVPVAAPAKGEPKAEAPSESDTGVLEIVPSGDDEQAEASGSAG